MTPKHATVLTSENTHYQRDVARNKAPHHLWLWGAVTAALVFINAALARVKITFRQRAQPSLAGYGSRPQGLSSARAALMSSSVPFVFQPVRLTDRVSGEKLLMADGAMTALFPAQLVRRNSSSIGFRPRPPPGHHPHHEIRGPVRSATAVIGAGISAREDLPPMCGPIDRVVEVVGRPRLTRLRRLPEPRCRAV